MFLCYTDGKTQLMVDATIQAETGKDANKPQGLTKKQKAAQYNKEWSEDEKINTRKEEMFQSKIANAIKMLRRAIMEGLRFDYLLVDSWFPCAELLQFIHSRHFKCNLLGMIKMGNTKYETALGNLCAPGIIKRLEKAKATKRNRSLGYTCASIRAKYVGIDVQLFFYKKGNGCWNALITTDMDIDAKRLLSFMLEDGVSRWLIRR